MGIAREDRTKGALRVALLGGLVTVLGGCSSGVVERPAGPEVEAAQRRTGSEDPTTIEPTFPDDGGRANLGDRRIRLEDQLERLASIGLVPNVGVTVDDFLRSFSREEYELAPFDLVLFVFGIELEREPFGRFVSDVAWNLDTECVEGPGSYRAILENLSRVAGRPDLVSDVVDEIDVTVETGVLEYTIGGQRRSLAVTVQEDCADADVVGQILADIEAELPGRRFYAKENGQASVWFALTPEQVVALRSWGAELSTDK